VHIHHLRKKLYPELIRNIRGVGYIVERRLAWLCSRLFRSAAA